MNSMSAFFTLFSVLLLLGGNINARKDNIGEYWRGVMKDEPMPEVIRGLVRVDDPAAALNQKTDCHTADDKNFAQDFMPEPTATAYDNGIKKMNNKFAEDFEPEPTATAYDNGLKKIKKFKEDFEPEPTATAYDNGIQKMQKKFTEDFDPEPTVTAYDNGTIKKMKKKFAEDFMPEPTATAYDNGIIKMKKNDE